MGSTSCRAHSMAEVKGGAQVGGDNRGKGVYTGGKGRVQTVQPTVWGGLLCLVRSLENSLGMRSSMRRLTPRALA